MTKPKYRNLTKQELIPLEKEFIEFLVVSGVTADDWQKIKQNDPDHADELISLFSDVVFESIFLKTKYMEIRGKNFLYVYQCLADQLVLMALEAPENNQIDFSDAVTMSNIHTQSLNGFKIYTSSKKYSGVREIELFIMLESGGIITDDNLFKKLSLAMAANH